MNPSRSRFRKSDAATVVTGILLAYALSPPFALAMLLRFWPSPKADDFFDIVYLPINWLCDHFVSVGDFYSSYGNLLGFFA